MPTRPTERRIPPTLTPGDLGESVAAGDTRCLLVSFITSPLVIDRPNSYVVFVTDDPLAAGTVRYEWKFALADSEPETQVTNVGETTYRPKAAGELQVSVRLVDDGGAEQATLALPQEVVDPNPELEALIATARNQPGPSVGNPEVARELVNDHNPYYQAVTPHHTREHRRLQRDGVQLGLRRRAAADGRQTRGAPRRARGGGERR